MVAEFIASASTTSGIRPFVVDDIPLIAALHQRVFGNNDISADDYRQFFSDRFLTPAQSIDGIGSLVYEEAPGGIVGFQGVTPRRMIFEGRPISMAILSHLVVDPAWRGGRGVRLLKQSLEGPQHLSIADEANDASRKIWEWCGGKTALLYSMHWLRPLRPCQTVVEVLLRRRSPRLARLSQPLARIMDALCSGRGPLRIAQPSGSAEELDESMMANSLSEFTAGRTLRPDYSTALLNWMLRPASNRCSDGSIRKAVVRDTRGEIAGWYLYSLHQRRGLAEVLQIVGRKETIGEVLDRLFTDASHRGAVALTGRLDPEFAEELSARYCMFYRRGHWMLIHSRRTELLNAIDRGDAFLSRLEGEWCLHLK